MFGGNAQTAAYLLQSSCAGAVLSAGHAGGQVIGDQHHHVCIRVHAVQKTGHARMRERAVTDHGDSRMLPRICGAFCHRHRCSHFHTRMDSVERRERSQGITTDVSEDPRGRVFARHLVERGIHVAVTAPLAQCGRTSDHNRLFLACGQRGKSQSRTQTVGRQLAHTRQVARQTAFDHHLRRHHAAKQLFHYRLTFFRHEYLFRSVLNHPVDHRFR